MTHSAVKVQIAEASVPSIPSRLGEVAAFVRVRDRACTTTLLFLILLLELIS